MENFKLKSKVGFIDLHGKRDIPSGIEFFASRERALLFVDRGFADILERPVDTGAKAEPLKEVKPEAKAGVKQPVSNSVVKKPVVKTPYAKVSKKTTAKK